MDVTQKLDPDYEKFKKNIFRLAGMCLDKYKERQMKRRITTLMNLYGINEFDEYFVLLNNDKEALQKFLDRTTINVSEFFRNPEKFAELNDSILPELIKNFRNLKIWSAGCSIGTEPYTLAMLMEEKRVSGYSILATDLDTKILEKAQEGVYTADHVKNVPPPLLKKYFEQDGDQYLIKPELKRKVRFKKQNMLEDTFERGFHLILCRNVVIYFTEEAKSKLYQGFADSLVAGGVLFIGNTERIFGADEMGLNSFSTFFYRKIVKGERV